MEKVKGFFGIKKGLFSKRNEIDMTEGSIIRHLLYFAVPLMIGSLFQQLYNMVDAWVVGNFVSNEAYSAVGTVGSVINMFIGFFTGLSSGAGVVISQYYGAKDEKKVNETVHTLIIMTLFFGVVFTILGVLLVPTVVEFMKTPEAVVHESETYLTLIFSGMIGCTLYNMGAGILRAIGDSRRPFYYLAVSSVINIVLDLLFVLCFDMGVDGVAYATIIAQGVSAILVVIALFRSKTCVRLELKKLRVKTEILKKVIKLGIPTAIQLSITSFSNVFVQSYINYFGEDIMSGWTTYNKVDRLLVIPMESIGLASTTFVAQNLGVKSVKRAKKGISYALCMSVTMMAVILIPIMLFAPYIVEFFNDKIEVVNYGSMFLRWLSPFYFFVCVSEIYSGALRGSGDTRAPMIIRLLSFVALRQIYLFVMSNYISNEVLPIVFGYPFGWVACSVIMLIYFRKANLSSKIIVE